MFHILVIDDDKNTRLLLKAVLEAGHYTVFTADNGKSALDMMDREHIDLVVLDIMMPKMDGYEFTKILRENQSTLPILMVSAKHLPEDKHRGITELSESFNKMAEELQSTEMLRSDFINNFSHEFKTPIVSIAGFAKLLKREQLTEQQMEYVRIIEEESLRLSQMANNVLNMTKVENQNILTDITTYNLSEQLRSCILLLGSKWEKKEIEFVLDFQEHSITGNEDLLQHVWLNLIDNAIKFSPQKGSVELTMGDYLDFVEGSVINTGTDIPQEKQQKIFNKFYQADESHAAQGNGVGLAVVKKIVDLHSGTVTVQSGNGVTVFSVRLPKTK